ncbi:mki67 interacting nucleolar phosphoprotein [Sporodiniella umbellata]|nr:mki67 interacting nucleolar phosphoprotein [Sporodiniella umbellata]
MFLCVFKEFCTDYFLSQRVRKPAGGVIYLGRIPHGFYEKEMKAYFKQFGSVGRVRVARSRKTGGSKHFGFVEFKDTQVAEIVAETMHNYLLLGHLLQCKVIPSEKVHDNLFRIPKRFNASKTNRAKEMIMKNKRLSPAELKKKHSKLIASAEKMRKSLKDAGIDCFCFVNRVQFTPFFFFARS